MQVILRYVNKLLSNVFVTRKKEILTVALKKGFRLLTTTSKMISKLSFPCYFFCQCTLSLTLEDDEQELTSSKPI